MAKKAKKNTTTALVAKTYTEEKTGLARLNLNAFEPVLKREILGLLQEANTAISSIARSHLQIGQVLSRAKARLEEQGKGIFIAFVNEIPGMALTTAYRYINAYDHARSTFPENILNKILAANLPMLGGPDQRYGKYTDTIKKAGLDAELQKTIDAGKVTEEYAENWIKRVQIAHSAGVKRGKHARVPDPTVLQQEAYSAIRRRYLKLPKGKKTVSWLHNLFAYVLSSCGFASPMNIDPRTPPKDWEPAETKDETNTKAEAKENGAQASTEA